MVKIKSPKMSFKGWEFKKWVVGNYRTIKELIKVGLPLFVAWSATADPTVLGIITLIGKFALDTLEYWYKESR